MDAKDFNLEAEKERLRLYYLELKRKKNEEQIKSRATSNGSRSIELYEKGRDEVTTKREQELASKAETPLVVSDVDQFPNHKCNLLYEESREHIARDGKERREKVEAMRAISNPKPPPAHRGPSPSLFHRKTRHGPSSPEEVVERLYTNNTISIEIQRTERSSSINRRDNSRGSTRKTGSFSYHDERKEQNYLIRSASPVPRS